MPQRFILQTGTDLKSIDEVLEWFERIKHSDLPKQIWSQCRLALVEAFTNAVRHAHRDMSPDIPVELEVLLFSGYLEMRIWDCGAPFDLEKRLKALPEMVDCDRENGRGLLIMRNIADRLSYIRTADNRNCLLIVKFCK